VEGVLAEWAVHHDAILH